MKTTKKSNRYKEIFDISPVAFIRMDYSPLAKLAKQIRAERIKNVRSFLYDNPSLVYETFHDVTILEANQAALSIYNCKNRKELFSCLERGFSSTARDVLIEQFIALLDGNYEFEGEFKYRSSKQMLHDLFMSTCVPVSSKKNFKNLVITLQDITTWKKLERQLRKKVHLDALTHLLNQNAVLERLESELLRAKRYALNLSCLMIDLDFFKVINDKFGHQRGDQILRKVAKMIKNCFRKVDIVGRYGGDEFVVILPETKPELAKYAAVRLQKIFSNTLFKYKKIISFHITLSIGITGYPNRDAKDAKDLLSIADKAMYQCKCDGRNRILLDI